MRRVLKKFLKKFLVSKAVDFKSSLLYNGFYIKEFNYGTNQRNYYERDRTFSKDD